MAIIQTVDTACEFKQAFKTYGREDNFSYNGLRALFDYLEQLRNDMGEDITLDVVGLCCDYSEEDYKGIANNYNIELSNANGDEDEEKQIVIDYLQYHTTYVGEGSDNNLVYQVF